MKSTEFITEAINKRSYNKSIIDVLKSHGLKVTERETSAGALKTWLEAVNPISLSEIVAALAPKFPGTKLEDWDGEPSMPDEVRGNGFQIEKQGQRSIFLAVYAGPKAKEYAMGLDEDGIDDDMADPERRQARLKAEIEAGMVPTVHNVSATTASVYTMGDVEALGWLEKDYHTTQIGDDYDVTWTRYYAADAPGPIKVSTSGNIKVWNPGHQEEE